MLSQPVLSDHPPRGRELVKACGFVELPRKTDLLTIDVNVTMLAIPGLPVEKEELFFVNKVSAAIRDWSRLVPKSVNLAIFKPDDPAAFRCTDRSISSHTLIRYAESIDEMIERMMCNKWAAGHSLETDSELQSLFGYELREFVKFFLHLETPETCVSCLTRMKRYRAIKKNCLFGFRGHLE
jgi:hypothetical protein